MPCCKARLYNDWCRDSPVIDYKDEEGNQYCVFHAPKGRKGIDADEFNSLVFERIQKGMSFGQTRFILSGTIFEGHINLSERTFPPLSNVRFDHAEFRGGVDFIRVNFGEDTSFKNAIFTGDANFSETNFAKVNFYDTLFLERAYFANTTFSKDVNFSSAQFHEETSFHRTRFQDEADFTMTVFKKRVSFLEAKFGGKTTFSRSARVLVPALSSAGEVFAEKTFGEGADFISINLTNKIKFEDVNLERVSFLGTDLREIEAINCSWAKKLFFLKESHRDVLYDEILLFTRPKDMGNKIGLSKPQGSFIARITEAIKSAWIDLKLDISCDKERIKKVETLYRRLKQKYKEDHNEYEVSNWHYGEKEMLRKGSRFSRFFPLSLANLYWVFSGYGERPLRAGLMLVLLILVISILFGITGIKPLDPNDVTRDNVVNIREWAGILNWDYFKATIQYATFEPRPDFMPMNWFLKIAAKLLISLQAALFALSVRNRFRR